MELTTVVLAVKLPQAFMSQGRNCSTAPLRIVPPPWVEEHSGLRQVEEVASLSERDARNSSDS